MIVFVFSSSALKTHASLCRNDMGVDVQVWSYDHVLSLDVAPRATYIFGDFDRLSPWDCELAAKTYRALRRAGLLVLNDAAVARQRFDLLRKLFYKKINSFQVWRAETSIREECFPVFVRTASMHRGVLSELLTSNQAVKAVVRQLTRDGVPVHEIMIVQFRAEELTPGVYRKLSAFCVGERIVPTVSVHEDHWAAKRGTLGIAGETLYQDEYELLEANPHEERLREVFRIARTDYGRVDYSIVDGRIEIYEINTNPHIGFIAEHPFPKRVESWTLFLERFKLALKAVDCEPGDDVPIVDAALAKQRRLDAGGVRSRWTS